MKKMKNKNYITSLGILFIFLLPFFAQAQFVNTPSQTNSTTKTVQTLNQTTGVKDSLAVVQITTLANGDFLKYNSTTKKWHNVPFSGLGLATLSGGYGITITSGYNGSTARSAILDTATLLAKYIRNSTSLQTGNFNISATGHIGTTLILGTLTTGANVGLYSQEGAQGGLTNSALRQYPQSGTNVASSYSLFPKGTGGLSTYKTALALFQKDYPADPTNWEAGIFTASGALGYGWGSYYGGSGTTTYPIWIDATMATIDHSNPAGTKQLTLYTDGNIGIGKNVPTVKLDVVGSINGTSQFQSNLDGSNTIGSGARLNLMNTANSRGIAQQLNASNGLKYAYFDGSTWNDIANLTNAGILSATSFSGPVTGNASTATALANARTIGTVTGDATSAGSSFDGTANNTNALTLATVNASPGTYGSATQTPVFVVNGKGLVTSNTNTTITPAVGSITGLGTGVATALAVNVGSAGAFVTFNGAGGTPSSMTGTNITGTASGLTAGNVTTNANLTGPITSVGNATSIAAQTGTGTTFAMSAGPTFTGSPDISTATGTSLNLSSSSSTNAVAYLIVRNSGTGNNTRARINYQTGAATTSVQTEAMRDGSNNTTYTVSTAVTGTLTNSFSLNSAGLFTVAGTGVTASTVVAGATTITSGTTLEAQGSTTDLVQIRATNNSPGKYIAMFEGGSNGSGVSQFVNAGAIETTGTGGLTLSAFTASAPITFAVNGRTTALTIASTGVVNVPNLTASLLVATNSGKDLVSASAADVLAAAGLVANTAELVSGTVTVTVTGATSSSIPVVTMRTPTGTTLTTEYQATCTTGSCTIQANVAAGTINTADASIVNYIIKK